MNAQLVIDCGRSSPHFSLPLNILVGSIPLSRHNLDMTPIPLPISGNENASLPPINCNLAYDHTQGHKVEERVLFTSSSENLGNL